MNREFIRPSLADVDDPALQVHLSRAAEEASELVKEAMKALRFGLQNRYPADGPTNAEKIVAEFRDIESALVDAGLIGRAVLPKGEASLLSPEWAARVDALFNGSVQWHSAKCLDNGTEDCSCNFVNMRAHLGALISEALNDTGIATDALDHAPFERVDVPDTLKYDPAVVRAIWPFFTADEGSPLGQVKLGYLRDLSLASYEAGKRDAVASQGEEGSVISNTDRWEFRSSPSGVDLSNEGWIEVRHIDWQERIWKRLRTATADLYEYRTTSGGRKTWDGEPDLTTEGWEPDPDRGRPGESWERFDYHEERYWRRLKTPQFTEGDRVEVFGGVPLTVLGSVVAAGDWGVVVRLDGEELAATYDLKDVRRLIPTA